MTREQILRSMECVLESDKRTIKNPISEYGWLFDKIYEWKKSLEQEPCEDCISRQVVLDYIRDNYRRWFINDDAFMQCINGIKNIISVTPQQKVGKWIAEINDYGEVMGWHCDKCYEDSGFTTTCKWDYCPNCGAKMEASKYE